MNKWSAFSKLMGWTAVVVLAAFVLGCGSNKQSVSETQASASGAAQLQQRIKQMENEVDVARQRTADLQRELEQLAEREKLSLQKLDQHSVLSLPNTLVFSSGSTRLSPEGLSLLKQIATILKRYPDYDIRVEGHTDNVQIKPEFQSKYASNWELSAARATNVVRHLVNAHQMDPRKLGAVGYGEHRPVAPNNSDASRAKNRRVEFHIYPVMQTQVLSMKG